MKHRKKADNGDVTPEVVNAQQVGIQLRRGAVFLYKAESFREAPTAPSSHFDRRYQCSSLACVSLRILLLRILSDYYRYFKPLTVGDRYW